MDYKHELNPEQTARLREQADLLDLSQDAIFARDMDAHIRLK